MAEKILVVEDDRALREFLDEALSMAGYAVAPHATADGALRAVIAHDDVDLVVTDLVRPGMRGHELLRELRTRRPELNVVVITAFGSIDSAIEMMKAGAYDYLTKPFGTDELLLTVERALADSRLRREVARLSRSATPPPPGFVGASRPMRQLFGMVGRLADSRHPVLVTGESGTGKELVARALHDHSGRTPFVAVNCAALPEALLESELFGHVRGAFTGADREKLGLFHAAGGGTLFLDEIGEMPLALQPKLLRALESGEVRQVGSTTARAVDVRVIAATNRDLDAEVAAGRFREDLLWRLNVLHLDVPPLRERAADVPLLAEHFLAADQGAGGEARRISREAMAVLTAYPWPGNVRELRNAIAHAATLASGAEIGEDDLPPRLREAGRAASRVAGASQRQLSLRDLEREYILEVMRQTGGNKSRAAEVLGLDRKTLYRKLADFGVPDV
ncbi:MAG: sigma-54-dependent Fis family transcriptional regulator [Gemmatimonadetes bacterium]|nr:sigma-54-dependent Fis family transcriptional regulator [Gemmatimonadota bacterium]